MSSIVVQSPPAQEPVTLTTLKNHLRLSTNSEDDLLKIYLQSAREIVESESGRSLVNKVYRQSHDQFPSRLGGGAGGSGYYSAQRYSREHRHDFLAIKLLRCPLISVQKISYIGTDGVAHDLLPTPQAWRAKTQFGKGGQVADSNGNLQEVTAVTEAETGGASISGASAPTWNMTPAGTTTDGDLTWTNKGLAPSGDFLVDGDSEPPRLFPLYGQVWPLTIRAPNAVQVFFTAGYGTDAADAPATLKVAVMKAVGVSYEHREAVTTEVLKQLEWYDRFIWANRVLDYDPTP